MGSGGAKQQVPSPWGQKQFKPHIPATPWATTKVPPLSEEPPNWWVRTGGSCRAPWTGTSNPTLLHNDKYTLGG